jgi:transcriptional regulator of acetoin/glycerol metabolism
VPLSGAVSGARRVDLPRYYSFSDEVGELPLELQAKLLRVLQKASRTGWGNHETIRTDVRVIAATTETSKLAKAEDFRGTSVQTHYFPIHVAPLRIVSMTSPTCELFREKARKLDREEV